ncbi:hypothetical protein AMTR_s00003p00271760 [Amborella trichopoda]|uniref:Retrotransposon gag domain-containing protein n=1 Tax=Amborella trichopoda TaxID=13333 RepID=W1P7H7_AMBTC|nr:hypothetical protein AMTR_s00003p00271760 [Amborella trichopoda]
MTRVHVHFDYSYDDAYLDGFADLPLSFVILDFRTRFNEKGDPQLHVISYLLVVSMLRDRPHPLKALFDHSVIGDALTWYNDFVRDYPNALYREMFQKFISHYHGNKPRSISLGKLTVVKQRIVEPFIEFVERFKSMASRATECPLSNHSKIGMRMENASLEYKTFFNHGGNPLTFNMMSERVELYERTKYLIAGTRLAKNRKIAEQSRKNNNNRVKPQTNMEVNQIIINQPNRQNQN